MRKGNRFLYRLGLDLGTSSLGWCLIREDVHGNPIGILTAGVRIFSEGRDKKSGTSHAMDRRMARGSRRRRDRYLQRRNDLMQALIAHHLMPKSEHERKALETLDPYEARARAVLSDALPLHHIGRALFHLNQRRGFASNRKQGRKEEDKGAIKTASEQLMQGIADSKVETLGQFLHLRHQKREAVRARAKLAGSKASYDFYPTRAMIQDEFNAIWAAQSRHHPELTDTAKAQIENTIFFQRELKEVPVGKCACEPQTLRAPWAHPLAQRFRILQEVRDLRIEEVGKPKQALTEEQVQRIKTELLNRNAVSFDRMRAILKLGEDIRFSLESERRPHLQGDKTAALMSHKNLFGKSWRTFSLERQIEIVERLQSMETDDSLVIWLKDELGLSDEAADRVVNVGLPEGHCRYGLNALTHLVREMEEGLDRYQAITKVYGAGVNRPTGEILERLPYYGRWLEDEVSGTGDVKDTDEKRFGRFPNPSVHIGLNQVRRVVNAIIRQYGPPTRIIVELARDLKISDDQKRELDAEQTANQKRNEAYRARLKEEGKIDNPSRTDRIKMRLWEELGTTVRCCPFSGKPIGFKDLMSADVEIEHLIPFSESLDDSLANKTVCYKAYNLLKGKQTPFQAFHATPQWPDILARASTFPPNKRWRFAEDALERLEQKGGFLARQLNETRWLSRCARDYLTAVCDPNRVCVITGKHTALIRAKWGLNSLLPDHNRSGDKNRTDHRHHLIDACVIALTDRSMMQKISSAYDADRHRIEVPLPWESLRADLQALLARTVVSHKSDHGKEGRLHEETAYGTVRQPDIEDGNLVYRKALEDLNESEIERIRDVILRDMVRTHVYEKSREGIKLKAALVDFRDTVRVPHIKHGLRRVRLLKKEKPEYLVPVKHRKTGEPYKFYSKGENFCVEIYETKKGKWHGEAISRFDANQAGYTPVWRQAHPDARLVMWIHKGDMIRLVEDGTSKIMTVYQLDASANRFKLAEHHETGDLQKRHDHSEDPFRWMMKSYSVLKQMQAEAVYVDELGRVWRVPDRENI